MRDVYCTTDAPQARNATMTIVRNGFSAHAPKLLAITGVMGSDEALVFTNVSRLKLNVRAAEVKITTLPTMQREKKDRAWDHPLRLMSFFGDSGAGIKTNEGPARNGERRQKSSRPAGCGPRAQMLKQFRK